MRHDGHAERYDGHSRIHESVTVSLMPSRPRPTTKGPPITLRLDLPVHEHVAARAEAHGQTIPAFLADRILQSFTATIIASANTTPANPAPERPRHPPIPKAPPRAKPRR